MPKRADKCTRWPPVLAVRSWCDEAFWHFDRPGPPDAPTPRTNEKAQQQQGRGCAAGARRRRSGAGARRARGGVGRGGGRGGGLLERRRVRAAAAVRGCGGCGGSAWAARSGAAAHGGGGALSPLPPAVYVIAWRATTRRCSERLPTPRACSDAVGASSALSCPLPSVDL